MWTPACAGVTIARLCKGLRKQESEHLERRQILALEAAVSEEKALKKLREVSRVELNRERQFQIVGLVQPDSVNQIPAEAGVTQNLIFVLHLVVAGHEVPRLDLLQRGLRVQPAEVGGLGTPRHVGALVREVYQVRGRALDRL